MFDELQRLRAALKDLVGDLQPETFDGAGAAKLLDEFAAIERLGAAGKALAARRVAESGAWRRSGERTPAHWMAKRTGTSVGTAVGVLETARRLSELPRTENALRSGRISEVQAREIASVAVTAPQAEAGLLQVAARESFAGLKEQCAAVRASSGADEQRRYEKVRERRRLRHWSDPDGAFRLDVLLTPDAGAELLAALGPLKEVIFTCARKEGRREPYEAYAADALVAMAKHIRNCEQEPESKGPKTMVHVFVDHKSLKRGSVKNGETCEIPGVGPVPVATAQALASDAFVKTLVTDGTDVKAVSHPGRTISARLRTAVVARDKRCVVPGCDTSHHLEIDHIVPRHRGGPTKLENLARLCSYHHYLKTHRGYRLGGKPGTWTWGPKAEPVRAGPGPEP